jgi:hypothetical protein
LSTGTGEIRDTLYWQPDIAFGILNAPSVDGTSISISISIYCTFHASR